MRGDVNRQFQINGYNTINRREGSVLGERQMYCSIQRCLTNALLLGLPDLVLRQRRHVVLLHVLDRLGELWARLVPGQGPSIRGESASFLTGLGGSLEGLTRV